MFFSVIVPIYGVEPYIRQCVDSILEQTYKEFELILVDDGSKDECPEICDDYARRDSRVKVIHKENGGLVSARQAGIQKASGNYIVNVDGDDWIAHNFLEKAYDLVQKTRAELISFSYFKVSGGIEYEVKEQVSAGLYGKSEMIKSVYPKLIMGEDMSHISYCLWGKAIRRDLMRPFQMAADTRISLGEDVACVVPVYLAAEKVYFCSEAVYYYRFRQGSESRSFRINQYFQVALVIQSFEKIDQRLRSQIADFEDQVDRYAAALCFALMIQQVLGGDKRYLKEIKRQMDRDIFVQRIHRAKFCNLTIKTRITLFLLRRRAIAASYWFFKFCEGIKQLLKI